MIPSIQLSRRQSLHALVACAVLCATVFPLLLRAQPGQPRGGRAVPPLAIAAGAPLTADTALASRIREHVQFLAGDELKGRRAGDVGNMRAASYIARYFRGAGLKSLNGSDMHRFEYTAGLRVGPANELILKGPAGSVSLRPGDRMNPLGFSSSAIAEGDLVFAGYGISAPDEKYDDYAGINVKGKVVVVMRFSPDGDNPHGQLARFAAYAHKARAAREHGAVAMIVINPPNDPPALVETKLDRNFIDAGIPAVFAVSTVFADIRDSAGRSLADLQKAIDAARTPASFAMSGYNASMRVDLKIDRISIPNVVGLLPGTDPKLRDEIIVIGGHFDHLGMGGEGSLDGGHAEAVHHGADDNASGTAGVIELARYFGASGGNRRTLMFVAFNGEEEGLLGSAALVADAGVPVSKMITMVNMDMIGRLDTSGLIVQGVGTSPWWRTMLQEKNADRFALKLVDDGVGPSDHSSFYAKGVPVLFFFTGLHADYHRPSDTWEKVNYDGEAKVLAYVAEMVRAIDARNDRPPFTKTQSSVRSGGGFKVYVGTIPDYGYEGKGLRLSGVAEGGPAQHAGLREGDILIRFGAQPIENIYDYTEALGSAKPGQTVEVEVIRGQEHVKLNVELRGR